MPGGDDPQAAAMMAQMFKGFRVRMMVTVQGEIDKTTASYVRTNSKSKKKDTLTLLDMSIGNLMSNPATAKKLQELGKIKDPKLAKQKLKDLESPDFRAEFGPKVLVRFK